MGYAYACPNAISYSDIGMALTFVVPAHKCNLNCSFCVIKQRKEATENLLSINDYTYFLDNIIKHEPLAVTSIQGYEPLLPESFKYTQAILNKARAYGIPRSFITNGYLLEERTEDIIALDPTGMSVSLDSAEARDHDKSRGLKGAFDKTIRGLRKIAANKDFAKKITISSVLMPNKKHKLETMPKLLADLGLSKWAITPLVQIGSDKMGGPLQADENIVEDVLYLSDIAKQHSVSVVLDDELRTIPREKLKYSDLVVQSLERTDGLIRLNANGACSAGTGILREVGPQTPIWNPSTMEPHIFVDSIRKTARKTQANQIAA